MAWNPAGSNLQLRRSRRRQGGSTPGPVPLGVPSALVPSALLPSAPVPAAPSSLGTVQDFLVDGLTQLGGLLALRRHLETVIDRYQPFGLRPALLLIDIDGFKRLNATYGRDIGDRILVETAARLRALVAGDDATYRTGGDEFVALLDAVEMVDGVGAAQRLQAELSRPVELARPVEAGPADGSLTAPLTAPVTVPLTVSVAVVMLGFRHRVDELLRDADVTMYRAKTEGGNRVDLYNWELDSWATARRRDAERLRREVDDLRHKNRILGEALTTDLATGMPNGLAFDSDHAQADALRKRSDDPYSVLRIRVDGLYEAAHEFRSSRGEELLRAVAHAVRATIRTSERAYVLDRGELAVLLKGSTLKRAALASDRVRLAVQKLGLAHPADTTRALTVSIAAIEAGHRHRAPADVMAEVDALLEKAVAEGGDRVVWPLSA